MSLDVAGDGTLAPGPKIGMGFHTSENVGIRGFDIPTTVGP